MTQAEYHFYNEMQSEELSTKSILSLFETNREQRKSFVNDIISRLEDGEVEPLVVHLQIKAMEDIITQLTSTDKDKNKNLEAATKYKKYLSEAFKQYAQGQKSLEYHNAKFTQMEAGTKYHYEKCGDAEMNDLLSQQAELKKKINEREKFLQNIPEKGMPLLDESTGEMVLITRPYKTSTTTISVSLK